MIYFLGIDPGKRGAWARVDENGRVVNYGTFVKKQLGIYEFPDIRKLMTEWYDVISIVIEEQCALPGSPVRSLAQQCTGYGALLGQLYAHPFDFNICQVRPSQWTGDLVRAGFSGPKSETGQKVTQSESFQREARVLGIKHDGILDAVGLASWKAWSVNGELRRRRMERARKQGLRSLGDEWTEDGDL